MFSLMLRLFFYCSFFFFYCSSKNYFPSVSTFSSPPLSVDLPLGFKKSYTRASFIFNLAAPIFVLVLRFFFVRSKYHVMASCFGGLGLTLSCTVFTGSTLPRFWPEPVPNNTTRTFLEWPTRCA